MSLRHALLWSLALHVALILAPGWSSLAPRARQPSIEVRLPLPGNAAFPAERVSTEADEKQTATTTVPAKPQRLAGTPLRNAQAALSRHLYYPPEAITRGLEGEVILLLSTTETGGLAAVEVARSSGHTLLDQAAVDAARHIGSLPGTKRQLLFPVRFRLQ